MVPISYIKELYGDPEIQDDLVHDGISLSSKNISATFFKFNNRYMKKSEIDVLVDTFKNIMYNDNNIK